VKEFKEGQESLEETLTQLESRIKQVRELANKVAEQGYVGIVEGGQPHFSAEAATEVAKADSRLAESIQYLEAQLPVSQK